MQYQRNTDDGRRTHDLAQNSGMLKRFTSMPSLGQLKDGQEGYIVGTLIKVRREGNRLIKSEGIVV